METKATTMISAITDVNEGGPKQEIKLFPFLFTG